MQYLAKFTPDKDGGILVTFPDIPEAITGGETEQEALANAEQALELAILTYAKEGRPLREARRHPDSGGSYRVVFVTAAIFAKLALIEAFRESGMTKVAFARKLGKAETEVRRMLDPYHQTKLATIEAGLRALGKRLVVDVEAA
jgi:antitoxin HicB